MTTRSVDHSDLLPLFHISSFTSLVVTQLTFQARQVCVFLVPDCDHVSFASLAESRRWQWVKGIASATVVLHSPPFPPSHEKDTLTGSQVA